MALHRGPSSSSQRSSDRIYSWPLTVLVVGLIGACAGDYDDTPPTYSSSFPAADSLPGVKANPANTTEPVPGWLSVASYYECKVGRKSIHFYQPRRDYVAENTDGPGQEYCADLNRGSHYRPMHLVYKEDAETDDCMEQAFAKFARHALTGELLLGKHRIAMASRSAPNRLAVFISRVYQASIVPSDYRLDGPVARQEWQSLRFICSYTSASCTLEGNSYTHSMFVAPPNTPNCRADAERMSVLMFVNDPVCVLALRELYPPATPSLSEWAINPPVRVDYKGYCLAIVGTATEGDNRHYVKSTPYSCTNSIFPTLPTLCASRSKKVNGRPGNTSMIHRSALSGAPQLFMGVVTKTGIADYLWSPPLNYGATDAILVDCVFTLDTTYQGNRSFLKAPERRTADLKIPYSKVGG
ncbi:uncharacterized protein LOC135826648 [Sycon ciliatum]|uniref:uncharacterized protein LOC135826648 n=1 Tax=Sycon ciliatum TaxID=27933 RepID=UPI0031F6304F